MLTNVPVTLLPETQIVIGSCNCIVSIDELNVIDKIVDSSTIGVASLGGRWQRSGVPAVTAPAPFGRLHVCTTESLLVHRFASAGTNAAAS
jgi:hypothetical protein